MKKFKTILLTVWIVMCVCFTLNGQTRATDSVPGVFREDVFFNDVNPLHPFGIFTLSTPFYVGTFNNRGGKFSVNYTMANIWHPQATVYYPQNLTQEQRAEVNELFYTKRPAYFTKNNIDTKDKTFSTDGVLQNINLSYLWQMEKKGTLLFKLNTYVLSGGSFPLQYPASDDFIEWVHDELGKDDNFGRRLFPFDQAHIEFTDENNKTIRINKGNTFLGTLDVHYFYPVWRVNNPHSYHTFQVGGHLATPLNKYYQKVSGGLSATLFYRKQIWPRFSMDISLNGMVTASNLLTIKESANIIDKEIRNSAKLYIGANFYKPSKDRTFYVGILNNYQDPYLKGYIFSRSQDKYQDLGVSFLKAGDTWEGEEVKKTFDLPKLTPASMYFFSVKTYLIFGRKTGKEDFTFTIGEDVLSVNNAPDIQFGFNYTRALD